MRQIRRGTAQYGAAEARALDQAREIIQRGADRSPARFYLCPTVSVECEARMFTFMSGWLAEGLGCEHTADLNYWRRS